MEQSAWMLSEAQLLMDQSPCGPVAVAVCLQLWAFLAPFVRSGVGVETFLFESVHCQNGLEAGRRISEPQGCDL